MKKRVVITGSGFVLPLGQCVAEVQAALRLPHGPFQRAASDPDVAVCPVPHFDLKSLTGRCKDARYLSRGQQFAVASALLALRDAGLTPAEQTGLFLGLGPNLEARPREDKALWLLDYLPNTAAALLAERLGVRGENLTIMTACAASTQALGQAYHAIAGGRLETALAGGGDSRLSPEGIAAYRRAGVLATDFSRPEAACRPFDQRRNGFAVGEGGAVFVLESLDHARQRQARILAEITGASSSLDGHSLTSPDPDGRAAEQAVQACLPDLDADNLCIVAHGTGTVLNDAAESRIMARTAGHALAICAFKSRMGHLSAACGSAELALALICSRSGEFPAIANLERPCQPDLPLLRQSTVLRPKSLLVQSFGFGGQNACLGVRLWM